MLILSYMSALNSECIFIGILFKFYCLMLILSYMSALPCNIMVLKSLILRKAVLCLVGSLASQTRMKLNQRCHLLQHSPSLAQAPCIATIKHEMKWRK